MTDVNAAAPVRIVPAGDATLIVELDDRVDPRVNARAVALAYALRSAALAGVRDVVPTFRSVGVFFDPLRTDVQALVDRITCEASQTLALAPESNPAAPIRLPVCYGGEYGPDLADVATFANLSEAETVRRHASAVYRVFMLGFLPGFPYMGSVDAKIAMPRKASPRPRVPEGSVGIAGLQTGIYPCETPGGWQLVGRTPVRPFDARRTAPFLLRPGDYVQFVPIAAAEFEEAGRQFSAPEC